MSRIPTFAFGYKFTHLPEFAREDVESLNRESVLYADHWIDELKDFRHVRIALTAEEAKEYARRCWAYELYLRAGSPQWARDTPNIEPDVAHDADTYEMHSRDGTRIPPPVICFAAFLGRRLEAVSCMRSDRQTLVFVVVDAVRDMPDPRLLEQEMTGPQSVKGRTFDVRLYVVEP
jgi:hypothetical protein